MKNISVLVIFVLLLSLTSCVNKTVTPATDVYDSGLPATSDITDIDFTAKYIKITPSDLSLVESFTENVRWIRQIGNVPTKNKNPELFSNDDGWAELKKITDEYTAEFFKTNNVFMFAVTVTSGSDSVRLTGVTQDKNNHIRFYVDTVMSDGGTADFGTWLVFVKTKRLEVDFMEVFVNSAEKTPMQTVENKSAGISFTLPEGWSYSKITNNPYHIGFDIGPVKYGGHGLEIYYNQLGPQGLCGTGLSSGRMKLGKNQFTAYSYENEYPFSFAYIGKGGHELSNANAGHWWDEYKNDVEQIFNSLQLSEEVEPVNEIDFSVQYVRAGVEYTPFMPYTVIIRSPEQLKEYISRHAVDANRDNSQYSDGTISFNMAAEKYTEEYFRIKQLILCMIEEPSGSIRHNVEKVILGNDDSLQIYIKKDVPEWCSDDMATWHIFVETAVADVDNEDIEVFIDGENKTHQAE